MSPWPLFVLAPVLHAGIAADIAALEYLSWVLGHLVAICVVAIVSYRVVGEADEILARLRNRRDGSERDR